MRSLGIDFGERRIGLAISDAAGRIATPFDTFERRDDRSAIRRILRSAEAEGVERFVLGEPRRLDGSLGEAAERIHRFAAKLRGAGGLPCVLVDEALTSIEAAQRLRDAGVDVRRDPARIDAVAAQIILQEALDRERKAPDGPEE